ncbi:hypothetical protein [Streptomyces sp. bgisy100]|uniref:hypothetical protein n=1 Tax=Streptomyces sp. bgisy100 TaxID=3413783 RepID=UPI003D72B1C4
MTRTKQILVTFAIAAATAGIGAAPAMADSHRPVSVSTEDHHAGVAPVEDTAVQALPGDHHTS